MLPQTWSYQSQIERERIRTRLRTLGAVSPATARSPADIDSVDAPAWTELLRAGTVREGPTGLYYLFEPYKRATLRARMLKTGFFWIIILLIPVILLKCVN
jgi:hypothetical protein